MQLKLSALPESLQVTEGSTGSLLYGTILKRHPIRPTCMPCGQFRIPVTKHPGPWSRACTGPTINIVRWYPRWFLITASLYSNMNVCVLGTLLHIP